jgi:hypothetical protein
MALGLLSFVLFREYRNKVGISYIGGKLINLLLLNAGSFAR